jgi:8-oxo-dGTP pyrophosphatase MutT (NUDIX family)
MSSLRVSPLQPLPRPESPNPYSVESRNLVHDTPWIRVRQDTISHRSGAAARGYSVVGFRKTACGVLAIDDQDRAVLVGQWRYPIERYSWEIVEGGGEPDESPFDTLRRELAEEAKLSARVWEPLAFHHPSNASTDEECFLMLATQLESTEAKHDDDEEFLHHRIPFEEALRRALSGEINDGPTMMALLALQARRAGFQTPMEASLAERFFQKPAEHPSGGRKRWNELDIHEGSK